MENKWYTGKGDDGFTSVIGRDRVPKYHGRTAAYGTVDEVSATLGLARASLRDERLRGLTLAVQRDLHKLMGDLATHPDATTRPPWLLPERVVWLEKVTDELGAGLTMPRAFIVPGDSFAGATLDVARTVVRRAERLVAKLTHAGELRADTSLKYLNRLSSLLFLMARLADRAEGVQHFTLATDDSAATPDGG